MSDFLAIEDPRVYELSEDQVEVQEMLGRLGLFSANNPIVRRVIQKPLFGVFKAPFKGISKGVSSLDRAVKDIVPGHGGDHFDQGFLLRQARRGIRAGVPDINLRKKARDLADTPFRKMFHERRQVQQDLKLGGHWAFIGGRPIFVEAKKGPHYFSGNIHMGAERYIARHVGGRPFGAVGYNEGAPRHIIDEVTGKAKLDKKGKKVLAPVIYNHDVYMKDVIDYANRLLHQQNFSEGELKKALKELQKQVGGQRFRPNEDPIKTRMQEGVAHALTLALAAREMQNQGLLKTVERKGRTVRRDVAKFIPDSSRRRAPSPTKATESRIAELERQIKDAGPSADENLHLDLAYERRKLAALSEIKTSAERMPSSLVNDLPADPFSGEPLAPPPSADISYTADTSHEEAARRVVKAMDFNIAQAKKNREKSVSDAQRARYEGQIATYEKRKADALVSLGGGAPKVEDVIPGTSEPSKAPDVTPPTLPQASRGSTEHLAGQKNLADWEKLLKDHANNPAGRELRDGLKGSGYTTFSTAGGDVHHIAVPDPSGNEKTVLSYKKSTDTFTRSPEFEAALKPAEKAVTPDITPDLTVNEKIPQVNEPIKPGSKGKITAGDARSLANDHAYLRDALTELEKNPKQYHEDIQSVKNAMSHTESFAVRHGTVMEPNSVIRSRADEKKRIRGKNDQGSFDLEKVLEIRDRYAPERHPLSEVRLSKKTKAEVKRRRVLLRSLLQGSDHEGKLHAELGHKFFGTKDENGHRSATWDDRGLANMDSFKGALAHIEAKTGKKTDYLTRREEAPSPSSGDFKLHPDVVAPHPARPGLRWNQSTGDYEVIPGQAGPSAPAKSELSGMSHSALVRRAQEELSQNLSIRRSPATTDMNPATSTKLREINGSPNSDLIQPEVTRRLYSQVGGRIGTVESENTRIGPIMQGLLDERTHTLDSIIADHQRTVDIRQTLMSRLDPGDLGERDELQGGIDIAKEQIKRAEALKADAANMDLATQEDTFADLHRGIFGHVPGGPGNPSVSALHLAAKEEFNLGDVGVPVLDSTGLHANQVASLHADRGELRKAMLRNLYDHTQSELARQGIDHVTVYRGVRWSPVDSINVTDMPEWARKSKELAPGEAGFTAIRQHAINSWTSDPSMALSYAHPPELGHGAVLAMTVPRERVLGIPNTGYGSGFHNEVMILGHPKDEVRIMRPSLEMVDRNWQLDDGSMHVGPEFDAVRKEVESTMMGAAHDVHPVPVRPPAVTLPAVPHRVLDPSSPNVTWERMQEVKADTQQILDAKFTPADIRRQFQEEMDNLDIIRSRPGWEGTPQLLRAENRAHSLAEAYHITERAAQNRSFEVAQKAAAAPGERTPEEKARLLGLLNRGPKIGRYNAAEIVSRVEKTKNRLKRDQGLTENVAAKMAIDDVAEKTHLSSDEVKKAFRARADSFNAVEVYLRVELLRNTAGMTRTGAFNEVGRELGIPSSRVGYFHTQVADNEDFFQEHIAPFKNPEVWDMLSRRQDQFVEDLIRVASQRDPDLAKVADQLNAMNDRINVRESQDLLDHILDNRGDEIIPTEFAERRGGIIPGHFFPEEGDEEILTPGRGRGSTALVFDVNAPPGEDPWKMQTTQDFGFEVPAGSSGLVIGEDEWDAIENARLQGLTRKTSTGDKLPGRTKSIAAIKVFPERKGAHPSEQYKYSPRGRMLGALTTHSLTYQGLDPQSAALASHSVLGGPSVGRDEGLKSVPFVGPNMSSRAPIRFSVRALGQEKYASEFNVDRLRRIWQGDEGDDAAAELADALGALGLDTENPFFMGEPLARVDLGKDPMEVHRTRAQLVGPHTDRLLKAVFGDFQSGTDQVAQDMVKPRGSVTPTTTGPTIPDRGVRVLSDAGFRKKFTDFVDKLGTGFPKDWKMVPDDLKEGERVFVHVDHMVTKPAEVAHARAIGAELADKGVTLVVPADTGSVPFVQGALAHGGKVEIHTASQRDLITFKRDVAQHLGFSGPQIQRTSSGTLRSDVPGGSYNVKYLDLGQSEVLDQETGDVIEAAVPGADSPYIGLVQVTHPEPQNIKGGLNNAKRLINTAKATEQSDRVLVYTRPVSESGQVRGIDGVGQTDHAVRVANFLERPVWNIRDNHYPDGAPGAPEDSFAPIMDDLGAYGLTPEVPSVEAPGTAEGIKLRDGALQALGKSKGMTPSEVTSLVGKHDLGNDGEFKVAEKKVAEWTSDSVQPLDKPEKLLLHERHGRLNAIRKQRGVGWTQYQNWFARATNGDRRNLLDDATYDRAVNEISTISPEQLANEPAHAAPDVGLGDVPQSIDLLSAMQNIPPLEDVPAPAPQVRDTLAAGADIHTQMRENPAFDHANIALDGIHDIRKTLNDRLASGEITPEEHNKQYEAHAQRMFDAQRTYNRNVTQVVSSIRPLGGTLNINQRGNEFGTAQDPEVIQLAQQTLGKEGVELRPASQAMETKMRQISNVLPREWLDDINANGGITLLEGDGVRSFFSDTPNGMIVVMDSNAPAGVVLHELTHAAVSARPQLRQASLNYLIHRAGTNVFDPEQAVTPVNNYAGLANMGNSDRMKLGIPGTGLDWYQSIVSPQNLELLSTGLETMFTRYRGIRYTYDPDLQNFLVGLLAHG